MTQRDRLAAILRDEGVDWADPYYGDRAAADALLARGVRVVDAETLARALHGWLCGAGVRHGDKGRPHIGWICERGAAAILAALDAER